MKENIPDKFVTDKWGMIVGAKEDPGDSMHRTCMLFLGLHWFKDKWYHLPIVTLNHMYLGNNKWCRHPSPGWWSDPDRISRDQATPLVIALSEFGYVGYLKGFFWAHLKRFGFFTNTRRNGATKELHGTDKYLGSPQYGQYNYNWKIPDYIGPEFIGIYIRTFNAWFMYPLLCILDLETFVGSLLWRYFKSDQTDVLNHMIVCEYASRKYPTPLSRWAKRINEKHKFNANLTYYFNRVGLPQLGELWKIQ